MNPVRDFKIGVTQYREGSGAMVYGKLVVEISGGFNDMKELEATICKALLIKTLTPTIAEEPFKEGNQY